MTPNDPLDKVFLNPQQRLEIAIGKLPADLKQALKDTIDQRISAAVAAERERCAKECEDFADTPSLSLAKKQAMRSCAFAIRALK